MAKSAIAFASVWLVMGSAVTSSTATPLDEQKSPPSILKGSGKPFVDRFERLDRSLWSVSDGWTNGPYMVNDWRREQVVVNQGALIALERKGEAARGFSSGEIQSQKVFGHGYYEVTMQAASGSGVVSGFFTYTGPYFKKPWNEIDVEILGKNTRRAQVTYFYDGATKAHTVDLGFDAAVALHHYAFDWQPGFIRWYIDGQLVHEAEGAQLPIPDQTQKIMLHLWGTDTSPDWAGGFDPKAVPALMRIGCVAYSLERPGKNQCSAASKP